MCRVLGMGLLGISAGKVFPATCGQTSDGVHDAVIKICVPLMPSRSPICHSPSLFPPASHAAHDLVLEVEKNEPLR